MMLWDVMQNRMHGFVVLSVYAEVFGVALLNAAVALAGAMLTAMAWRFQAVHNHPTSTPQSDVALLKWKRATVNLYAVLEVGRGGRAGDRARTVNSDVVCSCDEVVLV